MATLTINGTSFASLATAFANGAAVQGAYYSCGGKYGDAPAVLEPKHIDKLVNYTGVAGMARCRLSENVGRLITCTVCYIGTASYCNSSRDTFLAACNQLARYTIALPDGNTYQGCTIANSSHVWDNVGGLCISVIPLAFNQLSTFN